ncbi:MAG TPA: AtpZ/AtpI family protein [Leucothrix mucor]|nr:AtpZ/AtpI family protein [Leucothrix mucor]
MFFLILQMAFLLIIAISIGVILGWWLNKLKTKQAIANANPTLDATQGQQFALKNQLNKCFEDNSVLRRELKAAQESLESTSNSGKNTPPQDNNLQEKFNVLLDDLQIRDDTISTLTKELQRYKDN